MTSVIKVKRGKDLTRKFFFICLFALVFCLWIHPMASWADYAVMGENGYEIYTEEPDSREAEAINAQATLASLFGKNATIAVPPQIAGGTIALPSFDSSNLQIEEMTVSEDPRLATSDDL